MQYPWRGLENMLAIMKKQDLSYICIVNQNRSFKMITQKGASDANA